MIPVLGWPLFSPRPINIMTSKILINLLNFRQKLLKSINLPKTYESLTRQDLLGNMPFEVKFIID